MKNTKLFALVLAGAIASLCAGAAVAKQGDLYHNNDGTCDAGDTKNGYWCTDSSSPWIQQTVGQGSGKPTAKAHVAGKARPAAATNVKPKATVAAGASTSAPK